MVLASPVGAIEQDGESVRVRSEREVVRARRAIIAMAPDLTTQIRVDPRLSSRLDQLARRMASGPISTTFDNSPPDGAPGVLMRVHWAGAETSPVWCGYMEGAVRSGDRAAGEVLDSEGWRL